MRLVLLSLLLVASFHAFPEAAAPAVPAAPAIAARSWLLFDYNSGQTLAANNPQQRVEPASNFRNIGHKLKMGCFKGI